MGGSSSKSKAEKEKAKWNKAAGGSSTQGDVIDMLTEVRNTFSATVRNTVTLTSPHAHTRTQAQLDEFREAFAAFDKDGGGSIDATELRALMASVGQIPTDDELHEMIRIADADGSGSVDFYEFVTLMAHKMTDVKSEAHIKAAFSIFDFSGDGHIDAEEMRRIMMNVGEPVTISDINDLIGEVDKNGDGYVDYEVRTSSVARTRHATALSSLSISMCAGVCTRGLC